MRPLAQMPLSVARRIVAVFADLDDTITRGGRLPAESYRALEDLHAAGFVVAPITGRPAGWCDMIARFWPVTGVIGENGAFYFAYDSSTKRMRRVYHASEVERRENREKLRAIQERALAEIPGAAVSADQAFREADLAIDYCEDVASLDKASVHRIKAIFEEAGATAKISSIHVNGWFGRYDKLTMTRRFAAEVAGLDLTRDKERIVFVGDSPNDEPMFAFFPHACAVADIQKFAGELAAEPAYVTPGGGGRGFVEVAELLLCARKGAEP